MWFWQGKFIMRKRNFQTNKQTNYNDIGLILNINPKSKGEKNEKNKFQTKQTISNYPGGDDVICDCDGVWEWND